MSGFRSLDATTAADALLVEILRNDGSVLKKFTHAPGAWKDKTTFTTVNFNYSGDGSGPIKIRVGTNDKTVERFAGAIVQLILSKTTQ